jgi:hypothetical protein
LAASFSDDEGHVQLGFISCSLSSKKLSFIKKTMKKLTVFIAMIGALLLGCGSPSSDSMLNDDQMRKQVFANILSNHVYLKEFMDSMRTSDHARMMINSDTAMTSAVLNDMPFDKKLKNLMIQTENDSTACKMMCGVMMDHKKVMKTMLGKLEDAGEVDKGCMAKMKNEKAKTTEKAEPAKHH